jgi:uncharacterized membrane protein SpoIIM required for sporulation
MKVSDLLQARRENWRELEQLCQDLEGRSQRVVAAPKGVRFAALYRAVCADLALADAYQLPPGTVQYLHHLVGRAHNQLYRSQTFTVSTWIRQLLVDVPQRLFTDNYLRLSFCVFWGIFLLSVLMAYREPGYAEKVIGKEMITKLQDDFSETPQRHANTQMTGFYIFNNAGIGLRCFAFGLVFGVAGLYVTVFNAGLLGAVFGYMATTPQRDNFFHFVTAHGPFELTAVVLSAAAGMRMGFALIDTRGLTRLAALRQAAAEAVPTMAAAVVMFGLAALIEGLLSPSTAPYTVKALVAIMSTAMLMFYFVILGSPRRT